MAKQLEIISVNVGQPCVLRYAGTKPIYSSIAKMPVGGDSVLLTYTNLAGDQQVDTKPKPDGRQLHGGNAKAVYVYPFEHYDSWFRELGTLLQVPSFGENITLEGITEADVHVGDIWTWGDAELVVASPRQPCHKLRSHLCIDDIEARMWQNGYCGWYMRVQTPGVVPTHGKIEITHTESSAPTIADVFREKQAARTPPTQQ